MSPYEGEILRVDLGRDRIERSTLGEDVIRRFIGGTGLGAKFLYEEVPPERRGLIRRTG